MINNEYIAIKRFIAKMNTPIIDTTYLNHGRHAIIRTNDNKKYYLLFKKEFFMTFAKQFRGYLLQNPDVSKIGESINLHFLHYCIYHNVDYLVFIYPNNKVYYINPNLFLKTSIKYNLIRKQYTGEITCSIAINFLSNWDKKGVVELC